MKREHGGCYELSENDVCKAASALPLPSFENEEHELFVATEFAKKRAKTVGCYLLGLSQLKLRSEWRRERRLLLEQKRVDQWCELASCKWDAHRGKYVALNYYTPNDPNRKN